MPANQASIYVNICFPTGLWCAEMLPVLCRRQTNVFFERGAEMAVVTKTQCFADGADRHIRIHQEVLRLPDLPVHYILHMIVSY